MFYKSEVKKMKSLFLFLIVPVTVAFSNCEKEGSINEEKPTNTSSCFENETSHIMVTEWDRALIIEDSVFNAPIQYSHSEYDSVVYRNCTFLNSNVSIGGSVLAFHDVGVVRIDSCHFRNLRSTSPADYHAINIYTNVDSIIVTNSSFYNISADGIQVGHVFYEDTANNYLNYLLVDNCTFENPPNTSTENGIDLKAGFTIKGEIKNCTFKGFHYCVENSGCSGAPGEAIVVHYRYSENIYIHDNKLIDGTLGVAVGQGYSGGQIAFDAPPNNIHIYNNVIGNMASGINIDKATNVHVFNNFIYNTSSSGIYLRDLYNMAVNNNTVAKTSGYAICEYNASKGTTEYTNNLFAGKNGIVSMLTQGLNNLVISDYESIGFKDYYRNDFHLTSDSKPVIDQGTDNGISSDIDHETRPNGKYDVGADEYFLKNKTLYNRER